MRQTVAGWLAGTANTTSAPPPTQIGAGTGAGTPSPSDTALWAPIAGTQRVCDDIMVTQGYYAQYNITYGANGTDPLGPYTEVGLFDANGNLWAHAAINEYLSTGQTLTIQWMVLMQADTTNPMCTITNFLRVSVAQWMACIYTTSTLPAPNSVQLGTGIGIVDPSDTALWAPASGTTAVCDYRLVNAQYTAFFGHTYLAGFVNGTFTECGLIDAAGNLWIHGTLPLVTPTSSQLLSVLLQTGVNGDDTND